jgi:hypothetical protein
LALALELAFDEFDELDEELVVAAGVVLAAEAAL